MDTEYRFISPTDVDRFIQLPDTLQVDARDLVMTVQEDTLANYEHLFKNTDYAIYCEVPKATLFDISGMDWKYRIVNEVDGNTPFKHFRIVASRLCLLSAWYIRDVLINNGAAPIIDASASSVSPAANTPAKAIDGGWATVWSCSGYDRQLGYAPASVGDASGMFTTFDTSGVGYSGEWLQLQLPSAITLTSYSMARSTSNLGPKKWYLFASNDGASWARIDAQNTLSGNGYINPEVYNVPATTPYSYFRIVIEETVSGSRAALSEVKLYSNTTAYPPASMTADTSVLAGGTYIASASTVDGSGYAAYMAFDVTGVTFWRSTLAYRAGGMYNGTTYTQDVDFNRYHGEWFQVTVSAPVVLQSYTIWPLHLTSLNPDGLPGRCCPQDFVILGSTDGANWHLLDKRTGCTNTNTWLGEADVTFVPSVAGFDGVRVVDGHFPTAFPYLSLAAPIINTSGTKTVMGETSDATRFVHYKQCNRFFKYSFKVADAANIPVLNAAGAAQLDASGAAVTRKGQLYAVYLDEATGNALPYWRTVAGSGVDQTAETKEFFYADSTVLGSALSGIASGAGLVGGNLLSTLDGAAIDVSVVAPPDPEFLENKTDLSGGSLVLRKDASGNLVIRPVGERDASGNLTVSYSSANFTLFNAAADASRALMLYWVVNPAGSAAGQPRYMGEDMFVAWSSKTMQTASGAFCPILDMTDAVTRKPMDVIPNYQDILVAHKFVLNKDVASNTVGNVRDSISLNTGLVGPNAAAQLSPPPSRYIVMNRKPTEPDVTAGEMIIPFAYSVQNKTDFAGDKLKSILGGRIMQIISHYMFDAATNKELEYFPYLRNEARQLTDKIVDALAAQMSKTDINAAYSRTDMLRQIMVKHGRKYFDENAVLNSVTNERVGSMSSVISKIDELFIFFTVTLQTTISQRSKDNVDVLSFVEVPVVIRAV